MKWIKIQPLHVIPKPLSLRAARICDLQMTLAALCLIRRGCNQTGTLRTAGQWGLWSEPRGRLGVLHWNHQRWSCCRRRHCRCSCRWWWWRREALRQRGTTTHPVCPAGGGGERPASRAAGRTGALCSCTSCCRDAPCLCCCREHF